MHLGKKEEYSMEGTLLETIAAEKDIGVMNKIQENLKPSLHCAKTAAKADGVVVQLSVAEQWGHTQQLTNNALRRSK